MLDMLLDKATKNQIVKDIHFFAFADKYFLYDVNSGSISSIDSNTFKVLSAILESRGDKEGFFRLIENISEEVLTDIFSEFEYLVQNECLFTQDRYENYADTAQETILKSLCLNVSHDCNLRCRYCFAGTGNFGGERVNMPFEVGKKALDFLLKNSGRRKYCEVDFFGGEPLLNFEVVKKLVAYGKEQAQKVGKKFRFTLTTNGVLLNDTIKDFLNKEDISVVLSLDGRKAVHNYMRPSINGKGSYDVIIDKFKELVKSRGGKNYYLRGTFTRKNLDFSKDVLHMFDSGFNIVSVEPVVAPEEIDYAFKEEDKEVIKKEYQRLAKEYLKRRLQGETIEFFHFNVDFEGGPCLPKRLTGCGAGYQYLAVTPDGELYPCHQFVGEKDLCLGDVWQGIIKKDISTNFKEAHIYHKECKDCWARFLCSGGCHANAIHNEGSINKPYSFGCFMQKVRIESAMYIFAIEKMQ